MVRRRSTSLVSRAVALYVSLNLIYETLKENREEIGQYLGLRAAQLAGRA